MKLRTEMLKIIEAGLEKNSEKVKKYAELLSAKLIKEGELKYSERILNILEQKYFINTVQFDEFVLKPKDEDSKLEMVDVYLKPQKSDLYLSHRVEEEVDDYIKLLQNKSLLISHGLELPSSLLLYGPPGTGKTSLAHYIANELELPLVVARLDGLVSSLLGNTSKNIRKIFDYAKARPCVLFLDEFDAIAKSRDDSHEVGELKRVVNTLLQNIDNFTEGNNILIAATNHEKLLDPAIWRRFSSKIEIEYPEKENILKLINSLIKELKIKLDVDDKNLNNIVKLFVGISAAEIKIIVQNILKKAIINQKNKIGRIEMLEQIYITKKSEMNKYIFLYENGVTKKDIINYYSMSARQVNNLLKGDD
ncbi:MAG: AAA family ATPase [Fusobacteriaceae bacterium]